MLTYSFDDRKTETLYESLYRQIKHDIKNYKLKPLEKLPSKRSLAKHLNISTITVENAYAQLVAEGYIDAKPKSGYYVNDISMAYPSTVGHFKEKTVKSKAVKLPDALSIPLRYDVDFVSNATTIDNFPFNTWSRLQRVTMAENKMELMKKSPSIGIYQLRQAIATYLHQFRGLDVDPNQIIIGAGTEYLYGLIIQLLGHDKTYAVEDPGYQMIHRVYQANKVENVHIPLDDKGINMEALEQSQADVVHITPSHHFPTGIVTPISRRYDLLTWASKSKQRYIIEDDYDSEFRFKGLPIPALQSIDESHKVIYINTFSKSLAATIRISYMVLPKPLMERYHNELGFYACTVSNFEQYTLAKYIDQGYFEKHINRMRNYYRTIKDSILSSIQSQVVEAKSCIMEEDSGLHFLWRIDTIHTDKELVERAAKNGIHVSCLSQYYYNQANAIAHTLVINYSGVQAEDIIEGVTRLLDCFSNE